MVVSRRYFLERVFAGPLLFASYADIRGFSEPDMDKVFCTSIEEADEQINLMQGRKDQNIYFGVCPRQDTRGYKKDIAYAGCAWADLDAKVIGSKKEAYERVWNGDFARPTFLVDSGNGYHAYWCFIKPCFDLEGVEAVNLYIADKVGADHCFNINRLLRVPGTVNCKDPEKPKPCRIIHYSGFIYDYEFFPKQELIAKPERFSVDLSELPALGIDANTLNIGQRWKDLIIDGVYDGTKFKKPDGSYDRSARDFGVAMRLVGAGLSDAQIASIFLDRLNKISDKTYSFSSEHERKRYLKRTIGRARALVQQEA